MNFVDIYFGIGVVGGVVDYCDLCWDVESLC